VGIIIEVNLFAKPCCVYTLRDETGAAVYVGLSTQMMWRLGQHSQKPWWTTVASASFEHFDDLGLARRREAELVRALKPKHNVYLQEVAA
jgi:predicted GIY-YIG superfamily endonuclease